jgi:glycosyltransferase involved in cell wall biosynthesis
MRIAYVANYQGPTVVARRPIIRNLSMSNRVKVELIARLLHRQSHELVVISPGEPSEPRVWPYAAFREPDPFDPDIPVHYASALRVRRVTGIWSSLSMLRLLRKWNSQKPFELLVILNMGWPQLAAAEYAIRVLRIPVILEYEDDFFTSVHDERPSAVAGALRSACVRVMEKVNGCIGVSPYLLSQLPPRIPRMLLPGVVGEDVVHAEEGSRDSKENWVVFAGTHIESNGVGPLIEAWKQLNIPGWELHITGQGHLTPALKASAEGVPSIVFHGLVNRAELVSILSSAKICINPHRVSDTQGMVFAFKIIEYIAAGAHVITTPMGEMESALENAVTYLADNMPSSIAATLRSAIRQEVYRRTAAAAAQSMYGAAAVSKALARLVAESVAEFKNRSQPGMHAS